MAKRLTKQEFEDRACAVHGNRYDYSKVEYANAHAKVIILCRYHGEFLQTPTNHIHVGQGCPVCARGGTAVERFLRFTEKRSDEECWEWKGNRSHNGYGRFWIDGGTVPAHKFSLELFSQSKVPEGMLTLHSCDNPSCVNPLHLFIGTPKDNMQDMFRKGRARDQRGEKNNMSKLTSGHVREIRELYNRGDWLQRELAEKFNVTLSTVNQIVNWKKWKWLK